MNAARSRYDHEDHAEFLHRTVIAAACLVLLIVALLFVREIRVAPRALESAAEPAASVPTDAVSVPSIVVMPDREIRVGDAKPDTLLKLESQTLVKRTEERGPLGVRDVRTYADFTLVFEPFERTGEQRVAAIYVQ
jgi:hypothetical protein